jgi:hypothetical protein
MNLDLKAVPFSRWGAQACVHRVSDHPSLPDGLYLRAIHPSPKPELLRIEVLREGQPIDPRENLEGGLLRLQEGDHHLDVCMPSVQTLRLRGEGLGVRLTVLSADPAESFYPHGSSAWIANIPRGRCQLRIVDLSGALDVPASPAGQPVVQFQPSSSRAGFDAAIEVFTAVPPRLDHSRTFDRCLADTSADLKHWTDDLPQAPRNLTQTRELAGYLLWSGFVEPHGLLRRPVCLRELTRQPVAGTSDGCLHAIALWDRRPQAAWDQLLAPFDQQDPHGAVPASTDAREADWSAIPLPLHGWAVRWILERDTPPDNDRVAELYEPLGRWTDFWLTHRDSDLDGVPEMLSPAETGWGRPTVAAGPGPIESPALAGLLAVQMNVLSDLAGRLGRKRDQKIWQMKAFELVHHLVDHSWKDDRFEVLRSGSHEPVAGDSLLPFVPVLLGDTLPAPVRKGLVAGLRASGRFFTKHGMATESPRSELYAGDVLGRGPISPLATLLIVDGLRRSRQKGLAHEIARRFCRMCQQSGLASAFDAQTGQPLGDRASTTTAGAVLVLAREFLVDS